MSDFKDAWNEKYSELSLEMFDKEYWELDRDQEKQLMAKVDQWSRDWMADRIDAARERAKYGE